MEKKMVKEMINTNGGMYNYVANNYWNMSKEELKDILLETVWIATQRLSDDDVEAFYNEVAESLIENRCYDEE